MILDSQDNGRTWTTANNAGDPGDIDSVLERPEPDEPSTWIAAGSIPFLNRGFRLPGRRSDTSPEPTILTSDDGDNWNNNTQFPASTPVYSLALSGLVANAIIAVGGSGEIQLSTDGTNWIAIHSGDIATLFAVSSSAASFGASTALVDPNPPMIAVGASGTILTSTTGAAWNEQRSGTHDALYGVGPS